ncbi:AEC family transporter [Aeromicrobium alkaliterrae]|uniref:AEC family transporter n=1 Tax=Aeromicrobium alkaliterrae TaxID=302168 RepID=A0ABN2JX44_9ACTN
MDLLTGFGAIVVGIVAGMGLAHFGVVDDKTQQALGEIAFFVAGPALMITTISEVPLDAEIGNLATSVVSLVTCFGLYALTARLAWRTSAGPLLVGSLSASYVNIGNLGLDVAAYVVGDVTIVVPALLVQMAIVQPVSLVALDRITGRGGGLLLTARRTVSNPLLLAAIVGIALAATESLVPSVAEAPLDLLAGAAIPLMLLSYGAAVRLSPRLGRSGHNREVLLASLLKLFVMPLVAWSAGVAFGLRDQVLLGVVVTAALPTAQNVFLHATRYRVGEDVSRETILVTTVASLPVVLIIALVLG